MLQFGIDLGGTKTEIIVLDAGGNTLLRRRTPTPAPSYTDIVNNIIQMVKDAAAETAASDFTLGIGIPGAMSPASGLVKNANTTCLIGKDLKGDLERGTGKPVTIANDADCFALSEATDGAGAGYGNVFAVIIGTGCGGGWVVNGGLVSGPNAIAGEWGHNPLQWRSENDSQIDCYCGQQGCLETLLSGPGLRQQAELHDLVGILAVEVAALGERVHVRRHLVDDAIGALIRHGVAQDARPIAPQRRQHGLQRRPRR